MRILLALASLVALVASLAGCGGVAPTATPPYARHTPQQALDAFAAAGLAVADAADGVRGASEPWPATQRAWVVFGTATVPAAKRGGQVLTYATPADAAAMRAYLDRLPADLTVYATWRDDALLFLDRTVPKAEADRYRAAFLALP